MKTYKLVPGKSCSDCCFARKQYGVYLCDCYSIKKECKYGETVYKEVPATNGDKIREMTNEELAEFLEENNCPPGMDGACPARCSICWMSWLNAEAKSKTEGEPSK